MFEVLVWTPQLATKIPGNNVLRIVHMKITQKSVDEPCSGSKPGRENRFKIMAK